MAYAEFVMRRMLVFVLGVWLIVVGTSLPGCGPSLTDQDLGELQTKDSKLPGADEKYELPEPTASEEESHMDADHP
jgi:hypothetical protein